MSDPHPDPDSAPGPDRGGPRPLPEVLHSFYEERPFRSCTRCGESLEHFAEGYRISKNFSRGEVVMESAFCMPCLEAMFEESSEESKKAIARFHEENASGSHGFAQCAYCEAAFESLGQEDYSLIGICVGQDLHDSALICHGCSERISGILSEETRRTWDRFRGENFPGPPPEVALDLPEYASSRAPAPAGSAPGG